jgi:hypothetical protein
MAMLSSSIILAEKAESAKPGTGRLAGFLA